MPRLVPDQSFYPSPTAAMAAPAEALAYVALMNPSSEGVDALGVIDLDPRSSTYGQLIHRLDMPGTGDDLHYLGWNACSSWLGSGSAGSQIERRYLVVPGTASSRIHIVDTKPDPRAPWIVKVLDAHELMARTGYSRPHISRCSPDGIYVNALGAADDGARGGIFVLDQDSFEIRGRWETGGEPGRPAYSFGWHRCFDTMVTSECCAPALGDGGIDPGLILSRGFGHALQLWSLRTGRHLQTLDLGPGQQMMVGLRPAHNPSQAYGFVGVVASLDDLSASVWVWYREGQNGSSRWKIRKAIEIPSQPAPAGQLPDLLKRFGAVPPLVTDINLSLDDRFLYVSCWGTGELHQYDVCDPFDPVLMGVVKIGGILSRTPHPMSPTTPLNGGPQTVEISRDASRVYVTNSFYRSWDEQFYPDGIRGWMVKVDAKRGGGMALDPRFLLETEGMRPHQIRLQGGDASSDSYCFA